MTSAVQSVRLLEVLKRPATYGIVKAGEFQTTGVPMLRGGDIKGGRIGHGLPYVTQRKSDEFARTVLQANDVVVALVGYPGDSAVIPERLVGANISRAVGLLRPGRNLHPEYLAQYLNSPVGRAEFLKPSAGSAQIVVNLADLNKLEIPLPGLDEQRQIAEVLAGVDCLIVSLERVIAKKCSIKQGMMQELLTGRTRLRGFSGEWSSERFDDVACAVNTRGSQVDARDYERSGQLAVVDQSKAPIAGYTNKSVPAVQPLADGVLVFGDHTCVVKFVDYPFVVGADGTKVVRSRNSGSVLIRFIAYSLELEPIEPSGYNRHFSKLRERTFIIPPREEQAEIVCVLANADAEIEALERRLEAARAIKRGMMQELLTGRARLVPPEVPA